MDAHMNGIRMAYEDRGAGPALLLVHSFPTRGAMWQEQVAALEADYRLLVPDVRGFGKSDVPPGPSTMEQYADDMAALLDVAGVEQAVVAGLSMGGYIAMALLRRHAARVRALVLADTRATPDTPEKREQRETDARLVERTGAAALAASMVPNLLAPGASSAVRARLRSLIEGNDPHGMAGALRGMALREDSTALLAAAGQNGVPVLLVVGSQDALSPPAEMRGLQRSIPGSRLVEIADAGHMTNIEQPAAFTAALREFLAVLR